MAKENTLANDLPVSFKVVSKEAELPLRLQGTLVHNSIGCEFKAIVSSGRLIAYLPYTLNGNNCFVHFISAKIRGPITKRLSVEFHKATGTFPSRYLLEELIRGGVKVFTSKVLIGNEMHHALLRAFRTKLVDYHGDNVKVTQLWEKIATKRKILP